MCTMTMYGKINMQYVSYGCADENCLLNVIIG
jgi:hypothetical protein